MLYATNIISFALNENIGIAERVEQLLLTPQSGERDYAIWAISRGMGFQTLPHRVQEVALALLEGRDASTSINTSPHAPLIHHLNPSGDAIKALRLMEQVENIRTRQWLGWGAPRAVQDPLQTDLACTQAHTEPPMSTKEKCQIGYAFDLDLTCPDPAMPAAVGNPNFFGMSNLPFVGTYDPADYHFAPQVAQIRLPYTVVPRLPYEVRRALAEHDVRTVEVSAQQFNVEPARRGHTPLNLCHHASVFQLPIPEVGGRYNVTKTVYAGLINPTNLGSALDLPHGRLGPITVNPHKDAPGVTTHISPNNCRFTVANAAEDATCWSVCVDPETERAFVSYIIFSPNHAPQTQAARRVQELPAVFDPIRALL